ncbi:protein kinase [Frankia sp. AgB32]|uniref:protein kinase domain-containing protein n=1 Tax=Frankia sp. AgB32 TaxID=631119 RepID=UPI002010C5A3|nr:protein kinase [Frankia sp. AgB32]MCK9896182.1 protein kinase [Frankia sp. AgB32]
MVPLVLAHARARFTGTPAYLDADLRDVDTTLVPPEPPNILTPGRYLALSHGTTDFDPAMSNQGALAYRPRGSPSNHAARTTSPSSSTASASSILAFPPCAAGGPTPRSARSERRPGQHLHGTPNRHLLAVGAAVIGGWSCQHRHVGPDTIGPLHPESWLVAVSPDRNEYSPVPRKYGPRGLWHPVRMPTGDDQQNGSLNVFISVAGPDRRWARWIAQELRREGHTVEYDEWSVQPGESFLGRMDKGLASAQRIVMVISPAYFAPESYVGEEREAALLRGRRENDLLVPVLVAPTAVPPLFDRLSRVDFLGLGEQEARLRLVRAVRGLQPPALAQDMTWPGDVLQAAAPTPAEDDEPFPGKPADFAEQVGRLLGSGYQIGERLGAGSFGVVLAGLDTRRRREVAVKVLSAPQEDARARFAFEADVLDRLRHPHLARFYDYHEDDKLQIIVMELLTGGTLGRRVQQRDLSGLGACAVGLAVAEALRHVHDHNVLHLDIKPANVLFDEHGLVKVTDFGIARMFDGSTATSSAVMGTPRYMAPEQFRGEKPGPATDLYSLAVMLYELLSGSPMFGPDLPLAALYHHHLGVTPPPPPDTPRAVADVVMRALAKEPRNRQQSAREFALHLAAAARDSYGSDWLTRSGVQVSLSADVQDEATRRQDIDGGSGWFRRRRPRRTGRNAVISLVALVTVAAVAAAAILLTGTRNRKPGPPPDSCTHSNLLRSGTDCVGVTDGFYPFDSRLQDIEKKILTENTKVVDGGNYVTIALVAPLTETRTTAATSDIMIGRIRSELEGAYTAQIRANNNGYLGDSPSIRLLLANQGETEQAWQPVVEMLRSRAVAERLVAVVGLGISITPSVNTARAVAQAEIGMVGSVITADGVTAGIPGFVRATPTVSDEVSALASYLKTRPDLRDAALLSDGNPDDLYTSSLTTDFTQMLGSYLRSRPVPVPYIGTTKGVGNIFDLITNNIFCGPNPPQTIFYAGRTNGLSILISHLRQRSCARGPVTILTGGDASSLTLPRSLSGDAPVSVIYAATSSPLALGDSHWTSTTNFAQYSRFKADFLGQGFSPADLDDGWAILTHDAMATATKAIRAVTGQSATLPTKEQVRDALRLLNTQNSSIPGASGTFEIDSQTGESYGRPIPLIELDADHPRTVLATVTPRPLSP